MKYDILTVKEVAEELRCSKALIYQAVRGKLDAPKLPSIRLGKRVLIRRAVLEHWMQQNDGMMIPSDELAKNVLPVSPAKMQ
jgi:excisionase family DNA binding protein